MSIVRKRSNACEIQGGANEPSQVVKRNQVPAPAVLTATALAIGMLLSACTSGSGVGGEGTVDGTIDPVPADSDAPVEDAPSDDAESPEDAETPEDTEAPADE